MYNILHSRLITDNTNAIPAQTNKSFSPIS